MNTNLYKVTEIEGKGLGCVALKNIKAGTIILQEKAIMLTSEISGIDGGMDIRKLIQNFNKLKRTEQDEYMKLHNKYNNLEILSEEEKNNYLMAKKRIEEISDLSEKGKIAILNVVGIFNTNGFSSGIGLKSSRFNHSCCSNAESIFDENKNSDRIMAVSKIKSGDEITISYAPVDLPMQTRQVRQKQLLGKLVLNSQDIRLVFIRLPPPLKTVDVICECPQCYKINM